MTIKLPSGILEKTKRFKELRHENGKVYLWNYTALIDPLITQAYYVRLLEKLCGREEINKARYFAGKIQAIKGLEIINQKFGYAKTIPGKKKLFYFNAGQSEILGFGKYKWTLDFRKNYFVGTTRSPFAEEYMKMWGTQKAPVDHWFMGAWAGCAEAITKKKMVCVETRCIAKGNTICEFVVKSPDKWDKNVVQENKILFEKPPSMEDLAERPVKHSSQLRTDG